MTNVIIVHFNDTFEVTHLIKLYYINTLLSGIVQSWLNHNSVMCFLSDKKVFPNAI